MAIGDKIVLDDDFHLSKDFSSWNLVYEKKGGVNPTTGKQSVSMNQTYHANLRQALEMYVNQSLKETGSVAELIERLTALETKIEEMEINGVQVSGFGGNDGKS